MYAGKNSQQNKRYLGKNHIFRRDKKKKTKVKKKIEYKIKQAQEAFHQKKMSLHTYVCSWLYGKLIWYLSSKKTNKKFT